MSIYVQTDEFAVIGGNMVDPSMRRKGLSSAMVSFIWNKIMGEGKQGLAFLDNTNEAVVEQHKKLGFDFVNFSARIIIEWS